MTEKHYQSDPFITTERHNQHDLLTIAAKQALCKSHKSRVSSLQPFCSSHMLQQTMTKPSSLALSCLLSFTYSPDLRAIFKIINRGWKVIYVLTLTWHC